MTCTFYGPYQPSGSVVQDGVRIDRNMSHERVEFSSEKDMLVFLDRDFYRDPTHIAVSPHGTLVSLLVGGTPPHISVNISVFYLTVKGNIPDPELLRPFVKGKIYLREYGRRAEGEELLGL